MSTPVISESRDWLIPLTPRSSQSSEDPFNRLGENETRKDATVTNEDSQARSKRVTVARKVVKKRSFAGKKRPKARTEALTEREAPFAIVTPPPTDCSEKLDPFEALSITLNQFQEGLLKWYLYQYPKVQYEFNPKLSSHPVHTNFKISHGAPACFQVILARSALTQLKLKCYGSDDDKQSLEQFHLRHKAEAILIIRQLSSEYAKTSHSSTKDVLLASIMSLGNLDRRAGSSDSADLHYAAIRRLLKSTGGPVAIQDPALRRVSLFFESLYGTSPMSYIWEQSDFQPLLDDLNAFLVDMSTRKGDCLKSESTLAKVLSRQPSPDPVKGQVGLICQLASAFMLVAMVIDNCQIHSIQEMVDQELSGTDATTNVMWLLFQGDGEAANHSERMVRIAGWIYVTKYLSFAMKIKLKTWLLQYLTPPADRGRGRKEPESETKRLTLFDFSYTC